ncbi:MAG: hypothetical protein AB9921_08645 [Erysipelotrichaceae bacterium]
MKYLKAAFDFLVKHWIVLVPVFVATFIPALLIRPSAGNLREVWQEFSLNSEFYLANTEAMRALFDSARTGTNSGGMFATILNLAAFPMTAGLIKLGLTGENVTFNDFTTALSENIVKYLKLIFGGILLGLAVGLVSVIYVIVTFMVTFSGDNLNLFALIGLLLLLVLVLAVGAVFFTFWFAAMVLDDLTVMNAIKKSFASVKRCFWTVVGITLLIQILTNILSSIAGGFSGIPLIGALLSSVVATGSTVLTMAFTFILYRSINNQESLETTDESVIY